jgi:hypothetical protein
MVHFSDHAEPHDLTETVTIHGARFAEGKERKSEGARSSPTSPIPLRSYDEGPPPGQWENVAPVSVHPLMIVSRKEK